MSGKISIATSVSTKHVRRTLIRRSPVSSDARGQGPEALACSDEFVIVSALDDPKIGKRPLYWGSASRPIRVRELAIDRMRFAPGSSATDLIFADAGRAYSSLVEGAWGIYRDGTYYLFYSGDRCCGPKAHYTLMVARSKDAFGPFELLGAPILERSGDWQAPGHNCVVTDDRGTDWILYHAVHDAPRRLMLLDRLEYRDGWPRVLGNQPSTGPTASPFLHPS